MKKGFTLLELIIVIIIIGILASFALPQYIRAAERARSGEGASLLSVLRSSQLRYYAQRTSFTTNLADLDIDYTTPKYFNVNVCYGTDPNTSVVALLTRNGFQRPMGYGYVLYINAQGDLRCFGLQDICKGLGYESGNAAPACP